MIRRWLKIGDDGRWLEIEKAMIGGCERDDRKLSSFWYYIKKKENEIEIFLLNIKCVYVEVFIFIY